MFGFGLDIFDKKTDKDFSNVQEFLNELTWINAGGCGISALAMYRWLKKNNKLCKDTAFVYLDNDKGMYMNNKRALEANDVEPTSCGHIVLQHGNKYIDSNGKVNVHYRYQYRLRIESEQFVLSSVNNINVWNPKFNREMYVPFIAETLDIDLSDVELHRTDEHANEYYFDKSDLKR